MQESVQSCFELYIHFAAFFFPRTIFSSSSRLVRYTNKCTTGLSFLAQLHAPIFFLKILFLVTKVSNSWIFQKRCFMRIIWYRISIQTPLFQACLPTRQNGVENRDKVIYLTQFLDTVLKDNQSRICYISGPLLERVSKFNLLGVWQQDNLCWNYHIEQTVKKARNRLHYLRESSAGKQIYPQRSASQYIELRYVNSSNIHPQFRAVCRNTSQMSWSPHKTGVWTSLGYREHPSRRWRKDEK